MSQPSEDPAVQIMLAEYGSLRDEQLKRMDHRVTLIVAPLTISATLLGVGLERKSAALLLVTPVVAVLFGLLQLYHHVAIREIGQYLRDDLEAQMKSAAPGLSGWHTTCQEQRQRFWRLMVVWHLPIMMVTLVPSLLAIGLSFGMSATRPLRWSLLVVSVLLLGVFTIRYLREEMGQHAESDASMHHLRKVAGDRVDGGLVSAWRRMPALIAGTSARRPALGHGLERASGRAPLPNLGRAARPNLRRMGPVSN